MAVLKTKATESGMIYIPKYVRGCVGQTTCIITNACAAVMYPSNIDYEDVLASLEIIKADVQHRISLRNRDLERSPP